jgi:hypothetical protein
MDKSQVKALYRRLWPLYVSAFFQSFVLWYTIEKLFMQRIGFDNTAIGFMIALYSAVLVVWVAARDGRRGLEEV